MISESAQDALGHRIAASANPSEADLRELVEVERGYAGALASAVVRFRASLPRQPRGFPGKVTTRIKPVATLLEALRAGVRLSSVPDIAGVRMAEVSGISNQDNIVAAAVLAFPGATVRDTRLDPSAGYRAVHLGVQSEGLPVEVQVRLWSQHRWADATELVADAWGRPVRHGGAPSGATPEEIEVRAEGLSRWRVVADRLADQTYLHLAGELFGNYLIDHGADIEQLNALNRIFGEVEAMERFDRALAACPSEIRGLLFRRRRPSALGPEIGVAWYLIAYDRRERRALLCERHPASAEGRGTPSCRCPTLLRPTWRSC